MIENGALGRKVFFLYPPPVLSETTEELARREFEIYVVRDHERLARILESAPDAIVLANLDDGLDEPGWEAYIRKLRSQASTASVGIGVLTLNDRPPAVREKYLMELRVSCGFVVLKIGAARTAEILIKTLEANEARGRRKFVRALCPPGIGQCNAEHDGITLRAELTDLSSAGMAIRFDGDTSLRVGTLLRSISIAVKGTRLLASGFVAARRGEPDGRSVHVVMFDPGSLDETRRLKLQTLVYRLNQSAMDRLIEAI